MRRLIWTAAALVVTACTDDGHTSATPVGSVEIGAGPPARADREGETAVGSTPRPTPLADPPSRGDCWKERPASAINPNVKGDC